MARTADYQGFTIRSTPQYQTEWQEWRLHVAIACETPHGTRTRDFPLEIMYPSEEEADIHGITFGQRLIDGKVKGFSVGDMQTANGRQSPRFRVHFRTTFSDSTNLEGVGTMLDLSMGGSRLESPVMVTPGSPLELRIYVPDVEWPIMIDAARVQWINGQTFGLTFIQMKDSEQQRLADLIRALKDDEVREGRELQKRSG